MVFLTSSRRSDFNYSSSADTMLADMVAMSSSVRFYAWSLKIIPMADDHVFFIPKRIRLSICERDSTLPECVVPGEQGTEGCSPRCRGLRPRRRWQLAASPSGAPSRVLDGFAGNGRRFRHESLASVRFSAGVVRCRLLRPGETPALNGVSGRFGLRNRPEVASGARLC